MLLRSAIENALKGLAGAHDSSALQTTSVFELFDVSAATPPFLGISSKYFLNMKSTYKELCKYAHTATPIQMDGISALGQFPVANDGAFATWNRLAKHVATDLGAVILLSCPTCYKTAHYKIKEILDVGLPLEVRLHLA